MTQIDTGNEHLKVSRSEDGGLVIATITRPDAKNAFSEKVGQGLLKTLDTIDGTDVRVFVIRGCDGNFCSGGDLAAMGDLESPLAYREHFSLLAKLASRLAEVNALSIAAVEGYCLAGGLGVATACDILFASDDATFGTPEVNVGLFPMQAMAPILRTADTKKAFYLFFTGELIDAATADEVGMLSELVPADSFDQRLSDLIVRLLELSPVAIEMGKQAFYANQEMDYDRALEYLRECITLIAMSDDAKEGIAAFTEGRDPEWTGR